MDGCVFVFQQAEADEEFVVVSFLDVVVEFVFASWDGQSESATGLGEVLVELLRHLFQGHLVDLRDGLSEAQTLLVWQFGPVG